MGFLLEFYGGRGFSEVSTLFLSRLHRNEEIKWTLNLTNYFLENLRKYFFGKFEIFCLEFSKCFFGIDGIAKLLLPCRHRVTFMRKNEE